MCYSWTIVTMRDWNKGCITIIVVHLKWFYNHICYICDKGCLINRHQCDIDVMLIVRKWALIQDVLLIFKDV